MYEGESNLGLISSCRPLAWQLSFAAAMDYCFKAIPWSCLKSIAQSSYTNNYYKNAKFRTAQIIGIEIGDGEKLLSKEFQYKIEFIAFSWHSSPPTSMILCFSCSSYVFPLLRFIFAYGMCTHMFLILTFRFSVKQLNSVYGRDAFPLHGNGLVFLFYAIREFLLKREFFAKLFSPLE